MTQVSTRPPGPRPSAAGGDDPHVPSSPKARRVQRPRWRDSRLLVGVLLILSSVVLGARFVSGATRTSQWLSVTHSLPAGHVLTALDLQRVNAHLPGSASRHYFTAAPPQLVGRTLARSLAAGELLPADGLASGDGRASRVVPLVVKAGRMPALAAGDRLDVYVLSRLSGGTARELRVLTDVEFVSEDPLSTGETSVQLRVEPGDAIAAIAASQSGRVDVVRIDRDAADRSGDAGPASIAAFDSGG